MHIARQPTPGLQKIAELIDRIGAGMFTTVSDEGRMASRPMVPAGIDREGHLWFFTQRSSRKVSRLGQVNVSFSQPEEAMYVSMSGRTCLVDDAARAKELWS
ncbi:MAG: pyridoxamine 5'-phosphate oxidase family protein, partial [Burkholderiaceae bacterium]